MVELLVPCSPGELFDKISILEIKAERIKDTVKIANVQYELGILRDTLTCLGGLSEQCGQLSAQLKNVNATLWTIEDDIRDCERRGEFGAQFVALARAVYVNNDRRAALKREINSLFGSRIVEEKSYASYQPS